MNNQQQKHVDIIPMTTQQPTIEMIQGIIETRYRNAHTRKQYSHVVREFMDLGYSFTPTDIREYMSDLGNARSTVNSKLSTLKVVSGILHDEGLVTDEARFKIDRIKRLRGVERTDGNWLTLEEVAEVIDNTPHNVKGWRDKSLVSMLFATGLRRAEVRALCWDQLYWRNDTLEIRRLKTKGGSLRSFTIQNFAVDPLLTWGGEVARQFGLETNEGLPITDFPVYLSVKQSEEIDTKASGISDTAVTKIVARCGDVVDIPLRPHDCRRTYASMLHDSGFGVVIIQLMLGHSSLMTTQLYLNPIINQKKIHGSMIVLP